MRRARTRRWRPLYPGRQTRGNTRRAVPGLAVEAAENPDLRRAPSIKNVTSLPQRMKRAAHPDVLLHGRMVVDAAHARVLAVLLAPSACSMPWGVSSIMMSIVSLLTIALDSDRGYGRKPSWAMGPPSERWPIGGYLQLSTSVRACSAESTWGNTMPMAPASRSRVAR